MAAKTLLFLCLLVAIEAKLSLLHNFQLKDLGKSLLHHQTQKTDYVSRKRRESEPYIPTEGSEELPEDFGAQLVKFFVAAAWEGDKLSMLGDFLEEIVNNEMNVTLIGWQQVRDATGNIKEIRTLQLVIPPKPDRVMEKVEEDTSEDEERWLPHQTIKELKETFAPFEMMGMSASVTEEQFDSDGTPTYTIYMAKDELYCRYSSNFSIYNKTCTASSEDISSFIKSRKADEILGNPTVLKYDADGHFISEGSNIDYTYLGNVIDIVDVPDNITVSAREIMADVFARHPKAEIAKELTLAFNKKFPEYKWRVIVDPEGYWVTRDVELSLSYDNFDFYEDSDLYYLVYGNKK